MRSPTMRSACKTVVVICAFCVALAAATSAYAVVSPPPGQGDLGLPSGWVLQNYFDSSANVTALSFANTADGWAVLGGNGLSKTTDGGTTWTNPVTPTEWNVTIWGISFANASVGWAVGDDSTIYKSVDGGSTWTTATTDPDDGTNSRLRAVQAVSTDNAVAVGEPLLVLSTSDGSTWSTATVDGNFPHDAGLLALHMTDATHGWAAGYDPDGYGLVLGLAPNGHWIPEMLGSLGDRSFSSVWFTDSLHGWVVSQYVGHGADVYFTADGGSTWNVKASAVTTQDPAAIVFLNQNHGFIGCTPSQDQGQTFLETTDGGAHWSAYNPNPPGFDGAASVSDFAAPDAYHVWAGGSFGQVDPGAIWTLQTSAPSAPKTKQLLGAPVIVPQFPKTPFTVEHHDWLKVLGTLSPKHKPGTYSLRVVAEKRIGKKWVVKKTFKAKLSNSGWSYSAKIKFPNPGKWRIRAVHGSGRSAVTSAYTNYKVIVDDWDIP